MFRLPVCPYCHTVYRYGRVRKIERKEKTVTCYHCKKEFRVKRTGGTVVLGAIVFLLAVATNIMLLNGMTSFSPAPLIAFTVGYIILGFVLLPFFIDFSKTEKTEPKKKAKNSE